MAKKKELLHVNMLTHAQTERLAILAEECGEVVQAVNKILRHGYIDAPNKKLNRVDLELECGDVRAAMIRLCDAGDLSKKEIHKRANHKLKNAKHLHYQD